MVEEFFTNSLLCESNDGTVRTYFRELKLSVDVYSSSAGVHPFFYVAMLTKYKQIVFRL